MTRTGYYHLIHRKVAATEMLLMGGLSTGLVSNPSRASIEAQTEKVKAALVRGESFDSGKPFSPGKFHPHLSSTPLVSGTLSFLHLFWELTWNSNT